MDELLELVGAFLVIVVLGLVSLFRRWQEAQARNERVEQRRQRTVEDLPERTRRMLYGEGGTPPGAGRTRQELEAPVAHPRGAVALPSEQARPIELRDLFDALRGEVATRPSPPQAGQPVRRPPAEPQPVRQAPPMRRPGAGQTQRPPEERRVLTEQPARPPAPPMRQAPRQPSRQPARPQVARPRGMEPITDEERFAAAQTVEGEPTTQARRMEQRRGPQPRTRGRAPARPAADSVRTWFADRESIRRGVIMGEVLGIPKALRSPLDGPPGLTLAPLRRHMP